MPMYETTDQVDQHNKEIKRKRLIRLAVTAGVLILGAVLFFTRDIWLPGIRGVGRQYQIITNDGQLAGGNFPLELSAESDYQFEFSGKEIVVLNDAYIRFYNTEGSLIKERLHEYSNPVMRPAGNGKVLLYEHGGNEFCVENDDSILYSGTFEENIFFARISPEGYTAVVLTSDNFDCEVLVYNRKGRVIYDRKCIERVSGIGFRDESRSCVMSYLSAENGELVTSVQDVDLHENIDRWTSPGMNALGLEVYGYDDGAFVLGMEACGYINNTGNISSYYRYDGDLAGGDSQDGKSAVIVNNDAMRRYTMALYSGGGTEPVIVDFDEPLVDVRVSDGLAYVMNRQEITAYSFDGTVRSTVEISDSYTGFIRGGKYIFLKGFGRIDRIDFNS